jgi:ankyrin repeat protein
MDDTQEFFEEIKAGSVNGVRNMLNHKPGLMDTTDENGASPVLIAVYYGRNDILQLLLERKTNLDIWEAAATGSLAKLMELVQVDSLLVNRFSPDGFTPLGLAAFFGHTAVLDWLIANGADVNIASNNSMKVCPLHSAVAHRDATVALKMVDTLLQNGARANVVQMGGWTPLHEAASRGDIRLVRSLLRFGADKTAKNDDGITALDLAQQNGHDPVVELLRQA